MNEYQSYLPIFDGFYNTVFSYQYDVVLNYINDIRLDKYLHSILYIDNVKINYDQYEKDLAIQLCNILENKLQKFVGKIIFEDIYYPKQYNYSNDSINCKYLLSEKNIVNIQNLINEHKKEFSQYLKENYTSCDGFISHFDNTFETWQDDTNNFTDFSINDHYLGSILHFIAYILDINIYVLYNNIDIDEMGYIENIDQCLNTPICSNCNKFIEDQNILNKFKQYFEVMKKYHSDILCIDCLENN